MTRTPMLQQSRTQWWSPPREPSENPTLSLPYGGIRYPLLEVKDCEGHDWAVQGSGFSFDRSSEGGITTTLTANEIMAGGRRIVPFQLEVGWRGGDSSSAQIVGIGAGFSFTLPQPLSISVALVAPQGAFQTKGGQPTPNPPRVDATDFLLSVNARPTQVARGRGARLTLLDLADDEDLIRIVPPFADELEVLLAPNGTTATAIGVPSIRLNRGNDLAGGGTTIVQVPIGQRIIVPDCAAFYQIIPDPDESAIVTSQWRLSL